MLHWANRDQYYIKTSENFDHYTFDAREAARLLRDAATKNKEQESLGLDEGLLEGEPLRVHFRIVEAAEGEHNNVKESGDKKRYFIVDATAPIAFNEAGELECRFTYRPDPEKTGQENTWKQTRNSRNEATLLETITALAKTDKRAAAYLPLLKLSAARGKKKDERSLLGKYIEKYSATNSKDYFIHKDLGGFLRRELDFYLKNEVMRLDDLEGAEAPKVEHYLAKLRVIRRIAHKLTDFLAQLENFQKRLWLKKKFVVETNYCITLDRVPESLYPAIAANAAQKAEWEKLFAIEELPGYEKKKPLPVAFLKANPYLVLDTVFLSEIEKAELLNALDDLDAQCNGLLVHSENFQALNALQGRYREALDGVYIDPPYNTDASAIDYKNGYKSSSWCSLIESRLWHTKALMKEEAVIVAAIDDEQQRELSNMLESSFDGYLLGTVCVRSNPSGRPTQTGYAVAHEYLIFAGAGPKASIGRMPPTPEQTARFNERDADGPFEWRNLRREGSNSDRSARRALYYPIYILRDRIRVPKLEWIASEEEWTVKEKPEKDEQVVWPINDEGDEKTWRWEGKTVMDSLIRLGVRKDRSGKDYIYYKRRPHDEGVVTVSTWFDAKYSATEHGTALLKDMFGKSPFSYPKSLHAVVDAIYIAGGAKPNAQLLDYFGGSGTTAHAVIELNRKNGGHRKYLLVEMGTYFDTVTMPRVKKVIYSRSWKEGKPVDRDGISHCFKYIRLESYEDTLNALELRSDEEREKLMATNKELREDYTLRYLLDVETKESTSLLNHTAFTDPRAYTLNVKKPGSEERTTKTVDLVETFNYLLGLRVQHIAAPETFTASFERVQDADVPKDQPQRLVVKGNLKPAAEPVTSSAAETWWFRKVQGWMPRDRHKPHGEKDKVLIIWRTLTGDLEKDNAVLETYFTKNRIEVREKEYDVIYVNGSNNLPNLLEAGDHWKVRLIEEDFHRLMWEGVE